MLQRPARLHVVWPHDLPAQSPGPCPSLASSVAATLAPAAPQTCSTLEASPWLFPLPEMPFLQTLACLASFKSLPHLTFTGRPTQPPCLILPSAHSPPHTRAPYPPLRMDSSGQSTDCSPHVYNLPIYPACCRFPREAEDLRVFCSLTASRTPRTVTFILRRICV